MIEYVSIVLLILSNLTCFLTHNASIIKNLDIILTISLSVFDTSATYLDEEFEGKTYISI